MSSILVLEGGGLRGIYTAGVLDVLMENNIKLDAIIGVSAGALFGINYLTNQKGRCLKYNLEFCNNKNYMGLYSLLTTGNIMNKEFCFNKLIYETHPLDFDTFKKSKAKFYAVVTNMDTGKPEYIHITDLEKDMEYLRASGSMPIVSKPVVIGNNKYLDGGISDSIPVNWAIKNGYDKIIVVQTRPSNYRKKKSSIIPFKLFLRKYPNLINTWKNRYLDYNKVLDEINELDENKKIFVLRPSLGIDISRVEKNKEKIQKMYDLGVNDSKDKLDQIKKYLR